MVVRGWGNRHAKLQRTPQDELRDESGAGAHLLSSWLMIMYISQLVSSVIPP